MDISAKAQQVRSRRQKVKAEDLTTDAEGIFDWILDLIDADTKEKKFETVQVVLLKDQQTIKAIGYSSKECTEYNIGSVLRNHEREKLFKKLKKIVDKEKGFKSDLKLNSTFWETKAIIFSVTMD